MLFCCYWLNKMYPFHSHETIVDHLSCSGSLGQQPQPAGQTLICPRHFPKLLQGISSQTIDLISPMCLSSAPGSPPGKSSPGSNPDQMPKPSQSTPLVEEEQIYFELLSEVRAPHIVWRRKIILTTCFPDLVLSVISHSKQLEFCHLLAHLSFHSGAI